MRGVALPFAIVGVLLVAGAGRLVVLELTQGVTQRAAAKRQHTRTRVLPAQRGDILDCRGRILVGTVNRPSVYADSSLIRDFAFDSARVADALSLDAAALERRLIRNRKREFVWIKERISEAETARFEACQKLYKMRGFVLRYEPVRSHPFGRLASHVVGFVGSGPKALLGIERSFDTYLRGRPGRCERTVDRRGASLDTRLDGFVAPQDGASVVLTLDVHVQDIAERALHRAVSEHRPLWGIAIAMDPRSGEVLAMATAPDFDPGRPIPPGLSKEQIEAAEAALQNRCISDAFEPGSIFKPFVAAPALDDGHVNWSDVLRIDGPTHRWGRRVIKDTTAYETLDLVGIIEHSSNIGMGLIADRCGNAVLAEYVRGFGFGDRTGVRLGNEIGGLLRRVDQWTTFSTQSIPIGQELLVTGIQAINAFVPFCNDGVLLRPRVVRGVVSPDGTVLEDSSKRVPLRRVLSKELAREFRRTALRAVMVSGTGKRLETAEYSIFGKTGTGQVGYENGEGVGYIPGAYTGTFVCGAPVENPRIAVLVALHRPSGEKYYGGDVSGPAAVEIVNETLRYMGVEGDLPDPDADVSQGAVHSSTRGT